jgi:hypothetical protein
MEGDCLEVIAASKFELRMIDIRFLDKSLLSDAICTKTMTFEMAWRD